MTVYESLCYIFSLFHIIIGIFGGTYSLINRKKMEKLCPIEALVISSLFFTAIGIGYLIVDFGYKLFILCYIDIMFGIVFLWETEETYQKVFASLLVIFPVLIITLK